MDRVAKVAQHVTGTAKPGWVADLAQLAQLYKDGLLSAPEFGASLRRQHFDSFLQAALLTAADPATPAVLYCRAPRD